jgi:tRNA G18 (ribose-2'-O)-methylase SpoU
MEVSKVTRRGGQFQQWQALLGNRTKRTQSGKFFVQGVRPINAALKQKLGVDSLLYRSGRVSDWAKKLISDIDAKKYELSADLMQELGEKNEDAAEILLIVKAPDSSLSSVTLKDLRSSFILVLDRPQNPGNIGAVIRSADALGAAMVVIVGHAADVYDPKSVRASRGSLFAIPVIMADSPVAITEWINKQEADFAIIGLSEDGSKVLGDVDLAQPIVVVVGNETWGLSKQWKEICTDLAAIPMHGTASSLNAAASAAIALYEYSRQVGKA